jgi:hypothetical protein
MSRCHCSEPLSELIHFLISCQIKSLSLVNRPPHEERTHLRKKDQDFKIFISGNVSSRIEKDINHSEEYRSEISKN